jgi:hypothetical protein
MTDPGRELTAVPVEDSAAPESSAPPNIVTLTPCRCPGKPHPEDLVILAPTIPLALGMAGLWVIDQATAVSSVIGQLSEVYLRHGIVGWTFLDKDGKPEEITPANIARLLPFDDGGLEVAEAADALYQAALMRPLRRRFPERFPTGPTESSTPPTRDSGSRLPTHSGRSSRNGSAGKRSVARVR